MTFGVAEGEHFVPRLFAELGLPIRSVSVSRPSLDDVFMSYTGTTIRDAESSQTETRRNFARDDESLMATQTTPTTIEKPLGGSPRAHEIAQRARAHPQLREASCARSRSCGSAS